MTRLRIGRTSLMHGRQFPRGITEEGFIPLVRDQGCCCLFLSFSSLYGGLLCRFERLELEEMFGGLGGGFLSFSSLPIPPSQRSRDKVYAVELAL